MMIPQRIQPTTRVLAEDQPEYTPLPIRDVNVDGTNLMQSIWQPTPKQLEILNAGGFVQLSIMGTVHPPVCVDVEEKMP